ncbi:unnamed protein product [Phytophthora fragariaefolia]|uniref:Unnamed protein product n=1 Tax=Phytophthora fragariaefolia TaxID=1490495 RepID=A0A9W6XCA4_9STRA|nr:unnamed protein product [Phytophthora fragariaefolia]
MDFQFVLDEAMRYVWGFLLKRKEEAYDVVTTQVACILAQGRRVEALGCDGGGELFNNRLKSFLGMHGIAVAKTNPFSPEETGLVERMHRVVLARVPSMLTMVDLPSLLWGVAFAFAVEILNISPSSALMGETPYLRRFGVKPDVTGPSWPGPPLSGNKENWQSETDCSPSCLTHQLCDTHPDLRIEYSVGASPECHIPVRRVGHT